MQQQAKPIARWADSVYVKIPAITPSGASTANLVLELSRAGMGEADGGIVSIFLDGLQTQAEIRQPSFANRPRPTERGRVQILGASAP